jgi:hypothetical protein
MKKALVLFGVLAFVVNMGLSADNLSDGRYYVAKAKELFGDLLPGNLEYVAINLKNAQDLVGKYGTATDMYKMLKGSVEVLKWSATWKDANTDAAKISANKAASKSMLKVLDSFVSIAGGPIYGQVVPVLLKAVENTVDLIALAQARDIVFNEYASGGQVYRAGNFCTGWTWQHIIDEPAYRNIAVQIIASGKVKTNNAAFTATMEVVEKLEAIKSYLDLKSRGYY